MGDIVGHSLDREEDDLLLIDVNKYLDTLTLKGGLSIFHQVKDTLDISERIFIFTFLISLSPFFSFAVIFCFISIVLYVFSLPFLSFGMGVQTGRKKPHRKDKYKRVRSGTKEIQKRNQNHTVQ